MSVGTLGAGNGGFFVSTLSPADPSQDEKDMETVREVLRLDSEVGIVLRFCRRCCCASLFVR